MGISFSNEYDQLMFKMITSPAYRHSGGCMVVADIISKAMEKIKSNDLEDAERSLNWAKSILFDITNGRVIGTHKRLSEVKNNKKNENHFHN